MLRTYATGLTAIVVLAAAWVAVQIGWRRAFPQAGTDPDALAGRPGCGGCDEAERCERSQKEKER